MWCGLMRGLDKAVRPRPLSEADDLKEYELIAMRNEVAEIFKPIPYIARVASQISTCTFSASEAERCRCDGQASSKSQRIAICEDIITQHDREYWKMVFLHEFTHILTNCGHTVEFHKVLDGLIEIYNQETGERLVNDYQGLAGEGNG